MVAEWMESMQTREERAEFWRDHVAILGDAFLDRGIAPEVIDAILADHFRRVREIHLARQGKPKKRQRPAVDLDAPPAIGTEMMIGRRLARLVEVRPHVRRDGTPTVLLVWNTPDGMFTSGLRSGIYRVREETSNARG
ncbi:hypothetical protein G5B31_06390 [Rhodobacter sp. SGA-6-6]|uniref:hypothetical protein n=1 Tax=Rhodobacter sp. SGA-6-6 TaxID=2710882 RepID=UPI0013EB5D52|nr:hypothetical protein [Rhodobacter sp. SGA-6-6]NGM45162.1 hypothetical protein [Rhodobacter sp. SGA-6-6]